MVRQVREFRPLLNQPPVLADAIVEATETGSTLRANRLRILDTVMESNTQLIANQSALADAWKRSKIENIALLLKAAIEAQGRVGLMLNVRCADLVPAATTVLVAGLADRSVQEVADWLLDAGVTPAAVAPVAAGAPVKHPGLGDLGGRRGRRASFSAARMA